MATFDELSVVDLDATLNLKYCLVKIQEESNFFIYFLFICSQISRDTSYATPPPPPFPRPPLPLRHTHPVKTRSTSERIKGPKIVIVLDGKALYCRTIPTVGDQTQ